MTTSNLRKAALVAALLAPACGLELLVHNGTHEPFERPASTLRGTVAYENATITVIDANGNEVVPFQEAQDGKNFELRLPSGKYSMLTVSARIGDLALRAIVPSLGEETVLEGLNLDPRAMTEALIAEGALSASGKFLKQVTPDVYVATRGLIYAQFDGTGPAKTLLTMVERLITMKVDVTSTALEPNFFNVPVLEDTDISPEVRAFKTVKGALQNGWAERNIFDFDGDDAPEFNSTKFDKAIERAAEAFRPDGCPHPDKLRTIFSVNFADGVKNGNCGKADRFRWAVDKPNKSMFFVGWIHKDSPVQDRVVAAMIGDGTPNQIPMHDDGKDGDELAGDNIYSVTFDLPKGVYVGFKYTWGFRGGIWTGSEEWPGNSRIIKVEDVNGDGLVWRRDNWADEATNKDNSNSNPRSGGSIGWETDLNEDGVPEARENKLNSVGECPFDANGTWATPQSVGPLTLACTDGS